MGVSSLAPASLADRLGARLLLLWAGLSIGVAFLANAGEGSEPTRVCLSDVTLSEPR